VLDLLQGYFKIASEDDQRTRRAKVTGNILTLDRSLEDTLPYLFSLLGIVEGADPLTQMDGQLKKRRTLEAIKRILLRESLNQPLMVIFEDLHWIDEATQEFLNLLADSLGTAKLLLLVNYRPEYSHRWNSKTYYTQLRLDPLGKESAGEMLSALLTSPAPATQSPGASRERSGGDMDVAGRVRAQDSIEGLKRLIIDKTEGNPFFMEGGHGPAATRAGMKMEYGGPAPLRSRSFVSVVHSSPCGSLTAGHTVEPRIVASSTQSRISLCEYAPAHRRRGGDHEASTSALLRD
jgi:hypothetical protein